MPDNKENKQTRTQYKNDYAKNNYDRIALSVNKGKRKNWKYIVASMVIKV